MLLASQQTYAWDAFFYFYKKKMPFWPFKRSQQQTMNTFLIVGLGNVGADFHNTRHNIGFTVLDALANQFDISFSTLRYGDVAQMNHKGKKLILLCLLYTSPSPRDAHESRMPSSA